MSHLAGSGDVYDSDTTFDERLKRNWVAANQRNSQANQYSGNEGMIMGGHPSAMSKVPGETDPSRMSI